MLPICPEVLPSEIVRAAEALSYAYAKSSLRPRLAPGIVRHWDKLIESWSEDASLPLFIRKQNTNRGSALRHSSGRILVPCDNSPAHWAVVTAFDKGESVTLDDIRQNYSRIPAAMIFKATEAQSAQFKAVLTAGGNVCSHGWKLDHIENVGTKTRGAIEQLSIDALKRHFCLLMKPSNTVLVPMSLKGLGDLPSFLEIVKRTP
jgi:hypothetical protein